MKKETKTLTLSNGMKVEIDLSKSTGHVLMKARKMADGEDTVIFLISEIATFNGEKLPAPEILNLSAFDIIALERAWEGASGK